MGSAITEQSKIIHSLIHVTTAPPYTKSSVAYASQTVLNTIVRFKGQEARHKMRSLLESCQGNPLIATLCGYVFEPYAIELLEKGGSFDCRKLVSGRQKKPGGTKLVILPSQKIIVDKVEGDQTINQLYVPTSSNYTAIDAWIPGVGAFQMTVGKWHDIKGGAKADLAKLQGGNKLYWLLPPLYYQSFTKKTPLDIDQYALLIPYPE
jgi:hypothetical protein